VTLTAKIEGCQGHGQCYLHCPEVFVPDEEGYATVALDDIPESLATAVTAAEDACPEHAITVTRG
jgi:ferredoxin